VINATADDLRDLFQSIDQPIFALNLKGQFTLVNAACAAVRGRRPEQQIGQHYTSWVQNAEEARSMLDRALAGSVVSGRLDIVLPEGGNRSIIDRLGPWKGESGEVTAVWGVAADPELGHLVAEIEKDRRLLREVDEARANLLSIVSHELRTPLASIQGYASTYLLYEDRLEPEERRDFLRRIVDSTLQLEELVDNLLTASRIEHGTLEMSLRPAQLSKLVLEAISEAHQRWEKEFLHFEGPDRCELVLDPRRIRQVLHNLIDNAHKYGGDGEIEVLLDDQGEHVWLSVTDHGPGFAPGEEMKLFERFYRGGNETSAKGTGLGLWISKAIVEAHGGRMVAVRPPDGGAQFAFSLPRGLKAPEA
jgi:signal transduction histidine kinase